MKILVIGGTGPTGTPIVRRLVDDGHAVTILHRGTHERPARTAATTVATCRSDAGFDHSVRKALHEASAKRDHPTNAKGATP